MGDAVGCLPGSLDNDVRNARRIYTVGCCTVLNSDFGWGYPFWDWEDDETERGLASTVELEEIRSEREDRVGF